MPFTNGKVLDIGCGPAVIYENKDVDLTGVDYSAEALVQARKHYSKGIYIQAEATDIPLPDRSFDAILMFGLLDYFDDWTSVIKEARRLIKPDGKILATLLYGYKDHLWTKELVTRKVKVLSFKRITSNWYLIDVLSRGRER